MAMLKLAGYHTIKGWITGSSRGIMPSATEAVYNGKDVFVQSNVNISGIAGVGMDAAAEAFDEPLIDTEVLAIANLFIV